MVISISLDTVTRKNRGIAMRDIRAAHTTDTTCAHFLMNLDQKKKSRNVPTGAAEFFTRNNRINVCVQKQQSFSGSAFLSYDSAISMYHFHLSI
ncbi:unnamed protein product, partial [Brenthis ino]